MERDSVSITCDVCNTSEDCRPSPELCVAVDVMWLWMRDTRAIVTRIVNR